MTITYTLRLMSDTFRVVESQPDQIPALRVMIVAGPDAGKSYEIDRPSVIVGRGETADVRLSDKSVSEFHMEMAPKGQGILFSDCGSRNGVRVAGVLVERGIAPPGCVLTLGMTSVRIELAREFSLPMSHSTSFGLLIGLTPVMQKLYAQLEKLASIELSVLIEGETGTGKEVAARALHSASRRSKGSFVVLDCTTLQKDLAPSQLFGHERGAFTGAADRRIGVFEAAHDGVLFLDEVGELPLELQPMLLRALQEREIVPVGNTRPKKVNVRILSATHRNLRAMVNAGSFREDLYYRLVQDTVTMPALRHRKEDIGLLVEHFLSRLPQSVPARGIQEDALTTLSMREFPGNVRELQHVVERLAWLADGPMIRLADLASERRQSGESKRLLDAPVPIAPEASGEQLSSVPPYKFAKQAAIESFERNYLLQLIKRTGNNLLRAACHAGLQRHSLRDLLKKHKLYAENGDNTY